MTLNVTSSALVNIGRGFRGTMWELSKINCDMSARIHITVPDEVGEKLKRWADSQGRPPANLASHLVEIEIAKADREDLIPPPDQDDLLLRQLSDRTGLAPEDIMRAIEQYKVDEDLC